MAHVARAHMHVLVSGLRLPAVPRVVLDPAGVPIIWALHDQLHSSHRDTCHTQVLPVAANASPFLGMKSACMVCH